MFELIESFLKSPTGFVALISGLITLFYFLANRLIQVFAIDEIDRLFLDKIKQVNLKIWQLFTAIVYFHLIFFASGLVFNYSLNELNTIKPNLTKSIFTWSLNLFLLSLLVILIWAASVKSFKKSTNKIVHILLTTNLSCGILFYSFIFNQIIHLNTNQIYLFIVALQPVILVSIYLFVFSKFHVKDKHMKYDISIVSEHHIKIANLVHGYVLDEKKTICFPKGYTDKDIFYLCDFSSKVYLKYEKQSKSKLIIPEISKNKKRKIYRKRKY